MLNFFPRRILLPGLNLKTKDNPANKLSKNKGATGLSQCTPDSILPMVNNLPKVRLHFHEFMRCAIFSNPLKSLILIFQHP
ncbi:hypothetical protein DO021_09015 [Desulfobacter hydrogenophilus]|uniref:Uncharacterized protein n=1 Tax=Desulfobacter hydrogenophilus TaxID=2291 RepID=A0A328FH48_9BACT|nr:hypothetical protein DO021_09015 [Desulfobacter hydrogenophilus]